MNYKPINIEDIPYNYRHTGKNKKLLAEFAKDDCEAIEVNWCGLGYKEAYRCKASLATTIKREGYHMKAMFRNNRVFIVKMKGE